MRVLILVYGAFVVLCGSVGLVALYHSRKYRCTGDKTHLGSLTYITVMIAIVVVSVILIGTTDFSAGAAP